MDGPWEADAHASMKRRLGKSMVELGGTTAQNGCPDIWELDNGDIAVIGRDLTSDYAKRLPHGVTVRDDERIVILPREMLVEAAPDISRL